MRDARLYQPSPTNSNAAISPSRKAKETQIASSIRRRPPSHFLETHLSLLEYHFSPTIISIYTFFCRKSSDLSRGYGRKETKRICLILVFLKREQSKVTSGLFLLLGQELMQRKSLLLTTDSSIKECQIESRKSFFYPWDYIC